MGLNDALILPNAISPPIDIEDEQGKPERVLIGHLVLPRLVLLRPRDVTIVDELRLVALLKLPLEQLLLGLDGEVLVEAAPVVEVVVVEPHQRTRCPQHKSKYYRGGGQGGNWGQDDGSDVVLDVAAVVGRGVAAIGLEVARRLPLQIEFVDVLHVLGLDQLGDKLELLAEPEDGLLEDGHLLGRPLLEDAGGRDWVNKDVQVSLLVEVVDSIQVEFDRLLLFLRVGLVDLVLGLDGLKDRVLLAAQVLEQLHVGVVVAVQTRLFYAVVDLLEVRLSGLFSFLLLLGLGHPGGFRFIIMRDIE